MATNHVFKIRVTVLLHPARDTPVPALAHWIGWSRRSRQGRLMPPRMVWHEANVATGQVLSLRAGRSGSIHQADLGITWTHGWDGPDVNALVAAAALMC